MLNEAQVTPLSIAPGGTRYRDLNLEEITRRRNSSLSNVQSREVKKGDYVTVHYKVLKLGKRSYDGVSGEGTVVFSRGM